MDNQSPLQTPPEVIIPQHKSNYLKTIIFSFLIIFTLSLITYLVFQNQKLQKQITNQQITPTIEAPSPTPKPSSSISIPPDETAGWKTYSDLDWKFSIKYPLIFQFISKQTNANYIVIKKPGGEVNGTDAFSHFRITIEENTNSSIENAVIETQNNSKNIFGDDIQFTPTKLVNLGEIQGQSYYHSGYGYQQHVFITDKNSGMTIHFTIIFASQEVQKQEQLEVDQILSTFKFVDQTTDTSIWKTYPSTIVGLHYSFKYPNEVEISEAGDYTYLKIGTSTLFHRYAAKVNDIDAFMDNYQVFGAPVIKFNNKTPVIFGNLSGYLATSPDGISKYYFLGNSNLNGFLVFNFEIKDTDAENLFKEIIKTVKIK